MNENTKREKGEMKAEHCEASAAGQPLLGEVNGDDVYIISGGKILHINKSEVLVRLKYKKTMIQSCHIDREALEGVEYTIVVSGFKFSEYSNKVVKGWFKNKLIEWFKLSPFI